MNTAEHWEAAGQAARIAGYRSSQAGGPGGHWWLQHDAGDGSSTRIIDLNIGTEDPNDDYPYQDGTPRGFMMTGYKRPGGKALEVLRRVKTIRGLAEGRAT